MRLNRGTTIAILATVLVGLFATVGGAGPMFKYEPQVIVSGTDPADYEVAPGGIYSGVALIEIDVADMNGNFLGTGGGSGALLRSGNKVLTAAHIVDWSDIGLVPIAIRATFETDTGPVVMTASSWKAHPDWEADYFRGNDVGIICFDTIAPANVERYEIYGGSSEVGSTFTRVGYGISGVGSTGGDPATYPFGTKRAGLNIWDSLGDPLFGAPDFWIPGLTLQPVIDYTPGAMLFSDFDSGLAANDLFGFVDAYWSADPVNRYPGYVPHPEWHDTGLGEAEVTAYFGDSGGPNFIDDRIAGITSIGWVWEDEPGSGVSGGPDVDLVFNSSWGEGDADTRVSPHYRWINSQLPEPAACVLIGLALPAVLLVAARRRRRT